MGNKTIQLKLSRVLPAPREEVFDMWLNPESLKHWMCPDDGEKAAYVESQPIVGGAFRIDMHTKDGHVLVHTGQYLEIQRPEKLMFTWHSAVLGNHSSHVTIEFYEQVENCLMVLLHELPANDQIIEEHREGWTTVLDLLVKHQKAHKG